MWMGVVQDWILKHMQRIPLIVSFVGLQALLLIQELDSHYHQYGRDQFILWDRVVISQPFFHRYGVASFNLGFTGEAYSGVYHSIYDSFRWMSTFGNPQFDYYKAIAQFWGLVGIKLADDVMLPFNYTDHALDLETFLQTTRQLLIEYDGVDKVDLNTVQKAIAEFKNAAVMFGVWQNKISLLGDLQAINASNEILYLTERQFLGTGLKQRPYYRHVIQAPGLYLGYDTQVFPGVAQAVMELDWDQANKEANILANLIEKAALFLRGNLKDFH